MHDVTKGILHHSSSRYIIVYFAFACVTGLLQQKWDCWHKFHTINVRRPEIYTQPHLGLCVCFYVFSPSAAARFFEKTKHVCFCFHCFLPHTRTLTALLHLLIKESDRLDWPFSYLPHWMHVVRDVILSRFRADGLCVAVLLRPCTFRTTYDFHFNGRKVLSLRRHMCHMCQFNIQLKHQH